MIGQPERSNGTVVYLDDKLLRHPKLLAAAQMLGAEGKPRALWVFVAALSHASQFGTDGFVADVAVTTFDGVADPRHVAEVLAESKLLERVNGGYRVHGWEEWNHYTAAQIRDRKDHAREQTRRRVAAWRARKKAAD